MDEDAIAKQVVDSAYRIHTELGPGLLESIYRATMGHELRKRGLHVSIEQPIPIWYDGVRFEMGYQADIIVEDKVIIELKSVEILLPVHHKQLLTYLKVADKRLGLLINFNVKLIKDGIHRIVNRLPEEKRFLKNQVLDKR
jgi:GxxExxY protein